MASIILSLQDNYKDWQTGQSAEVDGWPLMESPGVVLGMLAAYLIFVLRLGPMIMRDRKPMMLRKTMVAYNAFQVIFSLYLVYKSSRVELPFNAIFSSACQQKVQQTTRNKVLLADGAWFYFIAKVTELLDTVFFVLRKRSRQVTFLHIYHHSATMVFSWCFLKYAPGEQGAMIGIVNSLVHIVMYTYYMIAAMGPAYQKYLWWKKYMTVMQLAQFCMIIAYLTLLTVSNCGYQRSVSYFFIGNAFVFLYLFSDFYRKAYRKSAKSFENGSSHLSMASANGKYISTPYSNNYMDDALVYSQITKDVALLDKGEKLNKRE